MISVRVQRLFDKLKYELVWMTPAKAAQLLEDNTINSRGESRTRANGFCEAMLGNFWHLNLADALIFVWRDGVLRTFNGQTRLRAVVLSGKPEVFVQVILDEETEALFSDAGLDTGRKRQVRDYFRSHDLGNGTVAQVSSLLHRQVTGKSNGIFEKIGAFKQQYADGIEFASSPEHCPARQGISVAIRGAIARAYYSHDRERLHDFGNMLAEADWVAPKGADSGVKLLYNLIYQQQLKFGGGGSATDLLYRYCAPAVHAFCQRRRLKKLNPVKYIGQHLPLPGENLDARKAKLLGVC